MIKYMWYFAGSKKAPDMILQGEDDMFLFFFSGRKVKQSLVIQSNMDNYQNLVVFLLEVSVHWMLVARSVCLWILKFLWAKLANVGFKAESRKHCFMTSLFGLIH